MKKFLLSIFFCSSIFAYTQTLASNFVIGPETCNPGCNSLFTDLPTPDSATFTLASQQNVIILYFAQTSVLSGGTVSNVAFIDGVQQTEITQTRSVTVTNNQTIYMMKTTLFAGTHTIDIQHTANQANTQWTFRLLFIFLSKN